MQDVYAHFDIPTPSSMGSSLGCRDRQASPASMAAATTPMRPADTPSRLPGPVCARLLPGGSHRCTRQLNALHGTRVVHGAGAQVAEPSVGPATTTSPARGGLRFRSSRTQARAVGERPTGLLPHSASTGEWAPGSDAEGSSDPAHKAVPRTRLPSTCELVSAAQGGGIARLPARAGCRRACGGRRDRSWASRGRGSFFFLFFRSFFSLLPYGTGRAAGRRSRCDLYLRTPPITPPTPRQRPAYDAAAVASPSARRRSRTVNHASDKLPSARARGVSGERARRARRPW